MSPNSKLYESHKEVDTTLEPPSKNAPWKYELRYLAIVYMSFLHLSALYGIYLTWSAKRISLIYFFVCYVLTYLGVTSGAHKLWSHRSYKAKLPLQIILMLWHSLSFQGTILWWSIAHRLHHKYSDTDADPHNASRGLFFSHVGWLLFKPHPEMLKKKQLLDVSDLTSNPVVAFQKKYGWLLNITCAFLIPTIIPIYFWNEAVNVSWNMNILRIAAAYHVTFIINSIAHSWGYRPYDKNIRASQSGIVSLIAFGEGSHNFHHVFPWDYSSDEFGMRFSLAGFVIEMFEKIGWSYDLKRVTEEMIVSRARKGDGSFCAKF